MVTRAWMVAAAVSLLAATARAEDATVDDAVNDASVSEEDVPSQAVVHHAPVLVAQPGKAITLSIDVEGVIERAHLVYRQGDPAGAGQLGHRAFVDETATHWKVTVPAEVVAAPGFSYTIEILEHVDGQEHRRAVFASRDALHRVQVSEPIGDIVERRLLEEVDGRRHQVTASGEWVDFGAADLVTAVPGTSVVRRDITDDRHWRAEARYHYRLLMVLYSLGLRVGVLRGSSPIEDRYASGDDGFDAALNYAVPELRFRFHDVFFMDAGLIVGVNDEGFAFGGAGALHIGERLGPRLTLGFEGVQQLGVTARSQVHLPLVDWLELAPSVELTNLPAGDRFGLRLLGDVTVRPGAGLAIRARGGYQTRFSHAGGPSVGGGVSYAF